MGTTPNLDLPYPEGTDLVIAGDDAIQALAEQVETLIYPDSSVTVAEGESAKGVGAATAVDFPGTASMGGFTVDGNKEVFTYTGSASRFFMISASVEIDASASSNTFESTVYLLHNGTIINSGHDMILSSSIDLVRRRVVHNLCSPAQLAPGNILAVTGIASPAGSIGRTSLRIYPIGPKLP